MTSFLSKLKVTPKFCFPFKISDDPTASIICILDSTKRLRLTLCLKDNNLTSPMTSSLEKKLTPKQLARKELQDKARQEKEKQKEDARLAREAAKEKVSQT